MLLFAPLHPSLELVGPHSSLLLLRFNLQVLPVASLLNLHSLTAASLNGSMRFPLLLTLSFVVM